MIERIAATHAALLFTILLVFGALTLWGLFGAAFNQAPGPLFLSALVIGELLVIAEALLGVVLLFGGLRAARPELHIVYAIVAIATLPAAHRYSQGRSQRQQFLIYALACLFVWAVALRGVETGRVPLAEQPAFAVQHPPKDGEMHA